MSALRGFVLGLIAFVSAVKPLANVMSDYTCHNRRYKICYDIHVLTSSLLPGQEKATTCMIAKFDSFSNLFPGRQPDFKTPLDNPAKTG